MYYSHYLEWSSCSSKTSLLSSGGAIYPTITKPGLVNVEKEMNWIENKTGQILGQQ